MSDVLDDNSLMPFGEYKGIKMCNVPASYLIHLFKVVKVTGPVKDYIVDNLNVLEVELKREKSKTKEESTRPDDFESLQDDLS